MRELQHRIFRSCRAGTRFLMIGFLVALVPGMLVAQTFDDDLANLRAELAEAFEVLPLSDGWLLQPLDDEAFGPCSSKALSWQSTGLKFRQTRSGPGWVSLPTRC